MTHHHRSDIEPEPAQLYSTDSFTPRPSFFDIIKQRRGWDQQTLSAYNDPSYDQLKDIDTMAHTLHHIKMSGQQIVVLPDYDMDGVTSGVLGWAGLNELGFNAQLYVPDHRAGHDITVNTVSNLKERYPNAAAVITCDGGINSNEGIRHGQQLGMTMLVTDHHKELAPGSAANVAVNPERMDETYAHPGICGAFVFYQVLMYYTQVYAPHKLSDMRYLKLFAGIGTVSDVMPLLYENRQIVKDSISIARLSYHSIPAEDTATPYDITKAPLIELLHAYRSHHSPAFISAFEGFALILKAFREEKKLKAMIDISEEFYGFYLSPTFNSVRRIDGDMFHAFGAFMAQTVEQKETHIEHLMQYNARRKDLVETYMTKLDEIEQPHQPYIWYSDAPGGMVGLLASRLQHRTDMPVIVLHPETHAGSARAPFWFNVITELATRQFIAVGHEQACGVRTHTADETQRLYEFLDHHVPAVYTKALKTGEIQAAQQADLVLGESPQADAEALDAEELLETAIAIEQMAPFGQHFRRPVIECELDLTRCSINLLGTDEKHISIVNPAGLKFLWWGAAAEHYADLIERSASPLPGEAILRVQGDISVNRFRGEESPQLVIREVVEPIDELLSDWDIPTDQIQPPAHIESGEQGQIEPLSISAPWPGHSAVTA